MYEVYDGVRCRRFTDKQYEKEKRIRAKKGYGFFKTYYVPPAIARKLGKEPKESEVKKALK